MTVVANCDEIEDKEEFAWKLIELYVDGELVEI